MTRDELIEFLRATITRTADSWPGAPRPQGTFLGNVASRTLSGLCLVMPGGTTIYLAVLEANDFADVEGKR
ncbi:MAG: hypothetical protein HBSAPP02_28550 [Phycisphaerae bacterium]|nr:MAG: hypothetical protein HBSAPP02_28550 [Phycisphaerae bacterium]